MRLLSANHLSFVSGGATDITATLPEVKIDDHSHATKSFSDYLPSLKHTAIALVSLVVGGLIVLAAKSKG